MNYSKFRFALYHKVACPFCYMVRRAIDKLDVLEIEQRDIVLDPEYRAELVAGGGKQQVPCLRIEDIEGNVEWLYESADIISYLNTVEHSHKNVA